MGDEQCGVYSDDLSWGGLVAALNGCERADEVGAAKGDAGCYGDLDWVRKVEGDGKK